MEIQARSFETIGYVFKVEDLMPVKYHVMENTTVLESREPFPGYHGKNLPTAPKPRNIYLLTREELSFEDIARISRDLKPCFPHRFNGTPAEIEISAKVYPSIRIKFLESFELITALQGCYQDAGIRFRKAINLDGTAKIKVHRYFLVEEEVPGIYRDLLEDEQYYIEVPEKLEWDNFKVITRQVKNNVDNCNFDAALGMMYRLEGPVELVRIWDRDKTLERIIVLREKYLEYIRRFRL